MFLSFPSIMLIYKVKKQFASLHLGSRPLGAIKALL